MGNLVDDLFSNFSPASYLAQTRLDAILSLPTNGAELTADKIVPELNERIDPNNKVPIPAELDDLLRLHFLTTNRKALTVMEFGVGKSSTVLADAMRCNQEAFADQIAGKLRRDKPFIVHSIDNNQDWIDVCRMAMPTDLANFWNAHLCEAYMDTFNGRICTFYKNIPNICPDIIYLDAPDQYSIKGDVRGITTAHPDRLPMAGDLLAIEHFLLPGTLIVVDGRIANARFLECNFQRHWQRDYSSDFDQTFFLLDEEPLGKYNRDHMIFATDGTIR